nr:uncharacterized protein LOC111985138 [Quercus suber]
MDETIWVAVDIRWNRPEAAKSIWDKATLAASNANSKALNAIFCDMSPEEFYRISHISIAKESCKLNEIVIDKFHLGEKIEDSKVVRKILRSLPESFRAKVTTIEESKDLDDIKVQELIGSLQTYELSLPTQRKRKSLDLKMVKERAEVHVSSDEYVIDKDVAYLVKIFWKFLKFKNNGKFCDKGKLQSLGRERKEFKKKDGKESQSTQGITWFECNGHGHFKKECPNYLKSNGKAYAITLSDSDSSNYDSKENAEEDESTTNLQENYNSFLEKSGEYTRVAKAAVKKMKKVEEDYRSLLVRHKKANCEIEMLNEELTKAYSKIKFLKLEYEISLSMTAFKLNMMAPTPTNKKTLAKKANKILKMDDNLFRFVQHFERYRDSFMKGTIIQERFVDSSDLRDTFIPECFKGRGWDKLLSDLPAVCEPLIREFYANGLREVQNEHTDRMPAIQDQLNVLSAKFDSINT